MASRYVGQMGGVSAALPSIEQFALCFPSQSWESYCTQKSFRSNVATAPVCVPGREVIYRA